MGRFINDLPYQGRQGDPRQPKKGMVQSRTWQVGRSKMPKKQGTSLMNVPYEFMETPQFWFPTIPKHGFDHTLVVQYTLSMFYLQCCMRVHSNNHCTGFLLSFWSSVVFSHGFSILQYANRVLNLLSTHLLQLVDCFFKLLVINIT